MEVKMFKNLFLLSISMVILFGCGSSTDMKNDQDANQEIVMLTIDQFNENPDDFVGKQIVIEGTVMHVCKHSGKRMFIGGGEELEERLQIKSSDEIATFDVDYEGLDVLVTGIVDELRIDESYLSEWENEVRNAKPEESEDGHTCEEGHDHDEGDMNHQLKQIENYRKMIADNGGKHLSFYSVIAKEYTEKK
jgi:hypothetical protein